MEKMALETRNNSRLYSRTADGGEVVQTLLTNLAGELANLPKKINIRDPHMVETVAIAYVNACAKSGAICSKIGLCRAMGMSRQSVDYFMNHHGDEPSAELLRIIFDSFAEMLNGAALANSVHPIVSIFLSKAIYGYRDTVSIETEPKHDPLGERTTAAEILSKYSNDELDMMLPAD